MRAWRKWAAGVLAAGGFLWGCGSDAAAPRMAATVTLAPQLDSLRAGTTLQVVPTVMDSKGKTLNHRPIAWLTSDSAIATVDDSGMVTGHTNGMATITAAVDGLTADAMLQVWVGVTGAWAGSLTAGTTDCPLTQSITEDTTGAIGGTGTVAAPCSSGSYTLSGMNNVGGVADSVEISWTGPFSLTFKGTFDGAGQYTGEITGGGCGCTFSFDRATVTPAPAAIRAATRPGKALRDLFDGDR
jgi:Bacterial Ig-like domain (group 2)